MLFFYNYYFDINCCYTQIANLLIEGELHANSQLTNRGRVACAREENTEVNINNKQILTRYIKLNSVLMSEKRKRNSKAKLQMILYICMSADHMLYHKVI